MMFQTCPSVDLHSPNYDLCMSFISVHWHIEDVSASLMRTFIYFWLPWSKRSTDHPIIWMTTPYKWCVMNRMKRVWCPAATNARTVSIDIIAENIKDETKTVEWFQWVNCRGRAVKKLFSGRWHSLFRPCGPIKWRSFTYRNSTSMCATTARENPSLPITRFRQTKAKQLFRTHQGDCGRSHSDVPSRLRREFHSDKSGSNPISVLVSEASVHIYSVRLDGW